MAEQVVGGWQSTNDELELLRVTVDGCVDRWFSRGDTAHNFMLHAIDNGHEVDVNFGHKVLV